VAGGEYCGSGSGSGCTAQPPQAESARAKAVVVKIRFLIVPLSALFYRLLPKAETLKYWLADS